MTEQTMTPTVETADGGCCGNKPPGSPVGLLVRCQLCPDSPTYWRNTRTEATGLEGGRG